LIQYQFVFPIDEYYHQEHAAPESRNPELNAQAETPESQRKQATAKQFHQGIPERNPGMTVAATPA